MSQYTMWDRDGLHVRASRSESGGVTIHGQDLRSGPGGVGEYEYVVSIPAGDVPLVIRALGGAADDDVLQLLHAHGETIVRRGERRWAEEVGVRTELATYGDVYDVLPESRTDALDEDVVVDGREPEDEQIPTAYRFDSPDPDAEDRAGPGGW